MEYKTERIGAIPFEINPKEMYIYSGYDAKTTPDDAVLSLMEECLSEVKKTADLRAVLKWCPIRHKNDASGKELLDEFFIGDFEIKSEALGKNLYGCRDAVLVGATLSSSVDLLLHRYSKLKVTRSFLLQAAAAAYIEGYLDEIQRRIKEKLLQKNQTLRPRFSPGFADFNTDYQGAFLQAIDAEKLLGITLAKDSAMMVPSKSVTAVMGICSLDS